VGSAANHVPFPRAHRSLTGPGSPLMQALIPLLLILTLLPSIVYGMVAGTLRTHRQAIEGMATRMSSMGY
jgi:aminobenzoyl-glutamate transport protein